MNEKKIEVESKAKTLIKPLEITDYHTFFMARKRLEVLTVIKEVLPASEQKLIARLRVVLGFVPFISRYEIDALKVEQLIKCKNKIYFVTPQFEKYLNELWTNVYCYRATNPNEVGLL
jgi:hypothetical protein